jgi:RHS repeat-associated protein
VNGSSVTGNLGWNGNGTLASLDITDPFNSSNQQNCTYGYDGLARLHTVGCGTAWSQTFSMDAFGNLSKSGTISFQPTYNNKNQVSLVGGYAPSYDADGNLLNDGVHTYTWDGDGNVVGIDSTTAVYDALGRLVEISNGSHEQLIYGPGGGKLALMNGQTLQQALVPLVGGAEAVYGPSGLAYYRHPDWLGSSRLASTPSRSVYYDGAYAPYGESYAESGTPDHSFTGQEQDVAPSGQYALYDFMAREYNPTWGRWLSPDPMGGNVLNPQSLNRYAYVNNNPLSLTDPLGLDPMGLEPCPVVWSSEGWQGNNYPGSNGRHVATAP